MQMNGYNRYQEQSVMTAGPGGLVLMLYDGCIKELKMAKISDEQSKRDVTSHHLIKAQNIIDGLIEGLNFDIDLSKQLYSLYDYMNHELMLANVEHDLSHVDTVLTMLEELRETWSQVVRETRQGIGQSQGLPAAMGNL